MSLFNSLCQCCSAYHKMLTEIQKVLSDDLWTMTQRDKFLTALIRIAGNDLATKFFQRAMAKLIGATHLIPSYVVHHLLLYPRWTVGLNVNQYINTVKNSSWIFRLVGTAWLMLLCLIACAFQNVYGIFKPFVRNGPWPVLSPECHLAHEHVQNTVCYGQGRMMGHKGSTRGPLKRILVCLQSVYLLCTWKFPYHCWNTCYGLNHPHLKD